MKVIVLFIMMIFCVSCTSKQVVVKKKNQDAKKPIPKKEIPKKAENSPAKKIGLGKKSEQIFKFTYRGKAKKVYLSGNFNKWATDDEKYRFKEIRKNFWYLERGEAFFKYGRNEYKIIVDGQWLVDPNSKNIQNAGLSGKVGVFHVVK